MRTAYPVTSLGTSVRQLCVGCGVLITMLGATPTQAQVADSQSRDSNPPLAGIWKGRSVCAVAGSPCHDEVNVYHLSQLPGKRGWFSVTGSKVVNGKEIVMGTADWKYDPERRVLETEEPVGVFRLSLRGNKLEGELTLRDRTVHRRIYLEKDE